MQSVTSDQATVTCVSIPTSASISLSWLIWSSVKAGLDDRFDYLSVAIFVDGAVIRKRSNNNGEGAMPVHSVGSHLCS